MTISTRFEHHSIIPPATQGQQTKAVDILSQETGLSKQRIKNVMSKGAVWLTRNNNTKRLRRATKLLHPKDELHLYYDEQVYNAVPTPAQLIADENLYSIWHKPYGMLSQGSKWGDHCTVNRWAEEHLKPQRPAFIVHRLDRAATGLIIVAHKKKAAAALSALFQQRQIIKRYKAVVHGHFPDTIQTIAEPIDGRAAKSSIKMLEYRARQNQSLVDITIESGRKHQIRRHLSGIHFPLVGDRLYGNPKDGEDLQLTAYYLNFTSPFDGENKTYQLRHELLLSANNTTNSKC